MTATGSAGLWQPADVTATNQPSDDEIEFELGRIPAETWAEFLRMVRLGIHRTGTVMESLGYRRQCVTMKKGRDPEFRRAVEKAEAEGRIAATAEMCDIAKKAGQWQALSRRMEIVHGECHPLDEAKIGSLNRAADPAEMDRLAKLIGGAFRTLPFVLRPDADEPPKADGEDGEPQQA